MHRKLRAIVRDRILLLLVVAFAVQFYRVVDGSDPTPIDTRVPLPDLLAVRDITPVFLIDQQKYGPEYRGTIGHCRVPLDADYEPISIQMWIEQRGAAFDFPQHKELDVSFSLPLGPDGNSIDDVQLLANHGDESLEKAYGKAEFDYGTNDSQTLKARSAYAAELLYRGDQDEAIRLLRQNYDAAMDAKDMAIDERLGLLLFSARELRAFGGDQYDDRLTRLVPLARLREGEAPKQVVQILNAIAARYLEVDNLTMALACFDAAREQTLDSNIYKLTMIETGLGRAVTLYRKGSSKRALEEAKRQLINVAALQQHELLPARAFYLKALHRIFEELGDKEYVTITEGLQTDES